VAGEVNAHDQSAP